MAENAIEIIDLEKTFHTKKERVEVLKGINLSIKKGDRYGIVGFSGAGKSTLIRCLNRLEEPDKGIIKINGDEITALGHKELNKSRQKIGMIFQHFNLFETKTVFQNVAFPLQNAGYSKNEIKEKIEEIIELVDLKDKINFYPGQLSGGQKQRVGIARALANNPTVLLSDEATSALDPQSTYSILKLLKNINEKLNLTIILITHELEVVKYVCNNMAVIENGKIVEEGATKEVFLNPKSDTAKLFMKFNSELQEDRWVSEGAGI